MKLFKKILNCIIVQCVFFNMLSMGDLLIKNAAKVYKSYFVFDNRCKLKFCGDFD